MAVVSEEHLTAAEMFVHSLHFSKRVCVCVCVCAHGLPHELRIVTYCFLINTWPLARDTRLVSVGGVITVFN